MPTSAGRLLAMPAARTGLAAARERIFYSDAYERLAIPAAAGMAT